MSREVGDYLAAPITSDGLAGLRIGDDLVEAMEALGVPLTTRYGGPDEKVLEYPGVVLASERDVITALIAEQGYVGTTPAGISVGAPWKRVVETYPDVAFDEGRLMWRSVYEPGIELEVSGIVAGTSPDEAQEEWYEVSDPTNAFVSRIMVRR